MVRIGEMNPVSLKSSMAATPDRASAKPLHNFDLPLLRWGNQRLLRCTKLDSDSDSDSDRRSDDPADRGTEIKTENGIAAVREKLLTDFKKEMAKIQLEILRDDEDDADVEARPWNLRTRRSACKAPAPAPSPVPSPSPAKSRPARRIPAPAKKVKLVLSREDVEADYRALVGRGPPRRPKKRPRLVQRDLEKVSPGLDLEDITVERYKLSEFPEL